MKRPLFTLASAAVAVVLSTGGAAVAGMPGEPSIGDPYFPTDGNTGYDVEHYDLRLKYRPGADEMIGTATIAAKATQELSRFSFDFGLNTSEVMVNGSPARFRKQGSGKLIITPGAEVPVGSQMTVVVRYQGVPSKTQINGEKAWKATKDGAVSTSQPHLAAFWFPCNDHPLDKALYDVSVSVPEGTQVLSSGVLVASTREAGWTNWAWRSSMPQASSLQFIAIGRYDIRSTTASDHRPFVTAYDKRLDAQTRARAEASISRTPEILVWEQSLLGPYPFEASGGVVAVGSSDEAQEFQTRPVYLGGSFDEEPDYSIVVHENAHQWFGDSVSVGRWQDIWLNEGFATYLEWLWSEHIGGKTPQQIFNATYNAYPSGDNFWKIPPGDPGAAQLLHDAVYQRGAMTLQVLRNTVGDIAFFKILRCWAQQQRYGNGTTGQFTALAERISGESLDALFRSWLYTAGRPAVRR